MATTIRFCALVTLLTAAFVSCPAAGKALEKRNWVEVRTANFTVRSLLGEKETVELARELEMFRAAVATVTDGKPGDASILTEVYALRRGREFEHFGIDPQAAGRFIAGLRNNTLLIRDADDIEQAPDLIHKYTHFLIGNYRALQYPKWYVEGMAEYLSGIRGRRNSFDTGLANKQRRDLLNDASWIPVHKILAAEQYYDSWTAESKAAFHAQAWALVHYLLSKSEPGSSLAAAVARYVAVIKSGGNTDAAFNAAFGMTLRQLDRALRRYVKDADYQLLTFDAHTLIPNFRASVVRPTAAQISLGLARAALACGELDSAQRWFTVAAADKRTRPRAETGLGDVFKFRGDFALALPRFEQALALAPKDLYVQLDLAEYWHYRAMNTQLQADRKKFLDSARNQYVKAWKLDDSVAEIYAMYGHTYLLQGDYSRGIEMLEEASRLLPASLDIRLILAEGYAGAGRKQQAIDAARSIIAWSHDSAANKRAKEVLAQLAAGPQ